MELKGKIKSIGEVQKGTSKNGNEWQKLTFVIANNDGYDGAEQIYAFDVFGTEKVEQFNQYNSVGKEVEVSFNIRTNEYQGKYFTSLQAWKIFGVSNNTESSTPTQTVEEGEDDLPW